ncbi:hypothetical protein FQA47_003109 [Oryzias melastigma]|uniref:Uncharacterized protein n=1 Tax=Oryzias melastigma TaxID=30732 RepID=A0A834F8R3_ORYME|nr:hypothetical protein FQA47_003109 [Oryzias melastigma]
MDGRRCSHSPDDGAPAVARLPLGDPEPGSAQEPGLDRRAGDSRCSADAASPGTALHRTQSQLEWKQNESGSPRVRSASWTRSARSWTVVEFPPRCSNNNQSRAGRKQEAPETIRRRGSGPPLHSLATTEETVPQNVFPARAGRALNLHHKL